MTRTPEEVLADLRELNAEGAGPLAQDCIDLIESLVADRAGLSMAAEAGKENLQNGWAALRMIREALELFAPEISLPSEEAVLKLHGPEPTDEATVLVEAIRQIATEREARRSERRE